MSTDYLATTTPPKAHQTLKAKAEDDNNSTSVHRHPLTSETPEQTSRGCRGVMRLRKVTELSLLS